MQERHFRWILATTVAWTTIVISGSVIAVLMGPFIAPSFGAMIRDPQTDGLLWPALLGGYGMVAFATVWILAKTRPVSIGDAAKTGLMLGFAVFVGDHLITAGWSTMPAVSMLISGLLDALACVAAAAAAHVALRPLLRIAPAQSPNASQTRWPPARNSGDQCDHDPWACSSASRV